MGFFDKVGSFFKREAKDIGDAAESVKNKLDSELTRREAELKMTPSEKIAALQQQAAAIDAKLDAIADKAIGRSAIADAVAEVGELPADTAQPTITHIVLPDGRVRSGHDLPRQISDGIAASTESRTDEAPAVEAPTVEAPSVEAPTVEAPRVAEVDEPPAAAAASGDEAAGAESESSTDEPVSADAEATPDIEPTDELPPPPTDDTTPPDTEPDDNATMPVENAQVTEPPSDDTTPPDTEPDDDATMPVEKAQVTEPPSDEPGPGDEPAPDDAIGSPNPSSRDYAKTPAQIKYEQARAAANDLLDELRGELKDDGEL